MQTRFSLQALDPVPVDVPAALSGKQLKESAGLWDYLFNGDAAIGARVLYMWEEVVVADSEEVIGNSHSNTQFLSVLLFSERKRASDRERERDEHKAPSS